MAKHTQPHWHPLDNTANLFPVITSAKEPNVFRLSVNLNSPVQPDLLQQALETVLPRFAALRVKLRSGIFWHYLDENPGVPLVREEDDYPCQAINPAQNGNFLFRVSYFGGRINLEVYHVLTDGTGGLQFLRALCCRYLLLAHPQAFTAEQKERQWFQQHAANTDDAYLANYRPTRKTNFKIGRGYRIRGERMLLGSQVVHAHIPAQPLREYCRARGVTITQYLTACVAWGVYAAQLQKRPSRHPLNIFLPVNLRTLFGTDTALNFFSNVYISLDMQDGQLEFDAVLSAVQAQFAEKITRQAMLEKISYTVGSGYSMQARMLPLPLKNLALRVLFNQSKMSSSLGFSNLGEMGLPEPFAPYVKGASLLLSCVPREPLKCTAASAAGILTLSFTSMLKKPDIQCAVLRLLAQHGHQVCVETNGVCDENM